MTDTNSNNVVVSTKVKNPNAKRNFKPVLCLECNKLIEPKIRLGKGLEPENEEIKYSVFLQCTTCKNYVGTTLLGKTKKRNNVYVALGSIPTEEIASVRSAVYDAVMRLCSKLNVSKSHVTKRLASEGNHIFRIASIDSPEQAVTVLKKLQELEEVLKYELENALPKEVTESRRRVTDTINNTCEVLDIEASEVHKVLSDDGADFKIEDINTLEDVKVVITKLRAYRKEVKAQSAKTA